MRRRKKADCQKRWHNSGGYARRCLRMLCKIANVNRLSPCHPTIVYILMLSSMASSYRLMPSLARNDQLPSLRYDASQM